MNPNPLIGLIYHWLGGLASASFYLPYKGVKKWSWQTYWLVGGVFSWIVAPWVFALLLVPDLFSILAHAEAKTLFWCYFFGLLWGFGGLTFGLTMRYLGIGLGMALALSLCSVFGTLMPPIFNGEILSIATSLSGQMVLLGSLVSVLGIGLCGIAGIRKERELDETQKTASVQEFSFRKGVVVAVFSGIMSSCFAYGLAAGEPIGAATKDVLITYQKLDLWQNLPILIVVLVGGFTTNLVWCLILGIQNKSLGEFYSIPQQASNSTISAKKNMAWNYLFSAIAGVTWYLQFFFYSMGQTKMGQFEFSSWTLHMASIILFSTLWGIVLKEWKGVSKGTYRYIFAGIMVLILSTLVVGYGNYIGNTLSTH